MIQTGSKRLTTRASQRLLAAPPTLPLPVQPSPLPNALRVQPWSARGPWAPGLGVDPGGAHRSQVALKEHRPTRHEVPVPPGVLHGGDLTGAIHTQSYLRFL